MTCDLNHRLAISEASVGRKKSCGQLRLKVRGQVCGPRSMPHHRRGTLFGMLVSLLVCMALLAPVWLSHPEYRILKHNAQH